MTDGSGPWPVRYNLILLASGLAAAAAGAVALLGWGLGFPVLAGLGDGLVPMAPSTALMFVLFGAALMVRGRPSWGRGAYWAVLAIALAGAGVALILLTLSSLGKSPEIEHLGLPIINGSDSGPPLGHMSPITAVCFLLTSLSLLLSLPSEQARPARTGAAFGLAGALAAAAAALLIAYLYGSPLFYTGNFIPPAATTSGAFLALGVGLLAAADREGSRHRSSLPATARPSPWLLLIFAVVSAGIVTAGWVYYRNYEKNYRSEVERELSSIADLKADELVMWRQERMGDAAVLYKNDNFTARVRHWLEAPEDTDNKERLLTWMRQICSAYNYNRVFLADLEGRELLSHPEAPEPPAAQLAKDLPQVLQSGRPAFLDFHRDGPDGPIHLAILVPVLDGPEQSPIAALVMRIDPATFLYPFINRWPTPSATAETLLVRRDGNHVLFLNSLRFNPDAALNLRVPLEPSDLPAARAARGETGTVEGKDYRGVAALAYVRPIPDSPWFMVAKRDRAEVYAPVRERLSEIALLTAVLLLSGLAGLAVVWRRQSADFYRRRYEDAEALRSSEERFHLLVEQVADYAIFMLDPAGRIVSWNEGAKRIKGYCERDVIGRHYSIFFSEADVAAGKPERLLELAAAEGRCEDEGLRRKKDGSEFWGSAVITALRDEAGGLRGFAKVTRDVTEKKRDEESLRRSEERYRSTLDNMMEGCQIIGRDWRYLYVNDQAARHGRCRKEELLGRTMMEVYPGIENTEMFAALRHCLAERVPHSMENEFSYSNGDKGWFELSIEPAPEGVFILSVDITERKKAERDLVRANRSLKTISECNQALVRAENEKQLLDDVCRILVNEGGYPLAWVGFAERAPARVIRVSAWAGEDEGRLAGLVLSWADDESGQHPAGTAVRSGQPVIVPDLSTVPYHGPIRPLAERLGFAGVISFPLTASGQVLGVINLYPPGPEFFQPSEIGLLTELADDLAYGIAALRMKAAHDLLQEQLLQSQKMEAVGKLAGGVAHDFNNQLTVILSCAEGLLREFSPSEAGREDVEEIIAAGRRSADLTRQLLAFSRKQVLEIKSVDLNTAVRHLEKMLGRLIGEDIQLASFLAPDLGPISADPAQLEQVIINLAVNARDAMPQGGKLTIETRNVELDETYAGRHLGATPGPYVMLSLSDAGQGMDQEILAHIFEPFFTTKEKGKGTGMGLAMVYGIVKQCGGDIVVYSEPGHGTTFKIYFPRTAAAEQPSPKPEPAVRKSAGGETVLVVEDEAPVRRIARRVLAEEGYQVLEAKDVEDAVKISESHPGPIHLLLTDVIMPGMSGREVAAKLAPARPEMKVLYMSGYTDNAIAHHGVLDHGLNFLQKPFTAKSLAGKVREVLEGN